MSSQFFRIRNLLIIALFSVSVLSGCAVKAAKETSAGDKENNAVKTSAVIESKDASSKTTIKIEPNSPADTVKVFYQRLREKKFREAMFLTNLRPAIESLTDAELKELQVDFEPLAAQVPADIQINGEIISQNKATVTAKLPDNETDKLGLQEIRLRREDGFWVILTVDESVEKAVKKEGKNYFAALKIKTHHEEAKAMMHRISKAQMIYAMQNDGLYADAQTLIGRGFLPADIQTPDSTGYNYAISLADDRRTYSAAATPAVYGKTGKLSFGFEEGVGKTPKLKSKDVKGNSLKL